MSHDALRQALIEQFGHLGPQVDTRQDSLARFPARHAQVGDVVVRSTWMTVTIAIGDLLVEDFTSYDTHLDAERRAERIVGDVARFLSALFADRLLFWKSIDRRTSGWRERGDADCVDPLVTDDRTYSTYLWSGPLSSWQATPRILARGRIDSEREYELMRARLSDGGTDGFEGSARERARLLLAEYERGHPR